MTIMENRTMSATGWTIGDIVQTFGFGEVLEDLHRTRPDTYVVLSEVDSGGYIAFSMNLDVMTWVSGTSPARRVLGDKALRVLSRAALYARQGQEDQSKEAARERDRADRAVRERAALVRYTRARVIQEHRSGGALCESGVSDFLDQIGAESMAEPSYEVTVTLSATFTVTGDYTANDVRSDVRSYLKLDTSDITGCDDDSPETSVEVEIEEGEDSDDALERVVDSYGS